MRAEPATAATVALQRFSGLGRSLRLTAPALAGTGALAVIVSGSLLTAAAAANGRYLLELPTRAGPGWIRGPLPGLGTALGALGPAPVSTALIALLAAYLTALICARSIPLRLALASVVLANLAFALGPTIVSTDVFGYIAYAREAAHGLNPYLSTPATLAHDGVLQFVYWKHQTSPYGPLFTALSAPLGLVPAAVAYWSYKLLAGVAAIGLALLVATLARRRGQSPARAAIFVGLNPVLLFYAVSGAHNDLLATLLVVGALALTLGGRESLGAGFAVAAAAVKLTLGLALPFVLIGARRRPAALRGAAAGLLVIGIPALLLFGGHFVDQLQRIATDPRFDIAFSGPDRLATALDVEIGAAVRALCTAAAATVAVAMIVRALRGADPIAAAGWALMALTASIASFAPWYLVWLLPLAALDRRRALPLAAVLATVYVIGVHLPALGGHPWLSGPVSSPGPLAAP